MGLFKDFKEDFAQATKEMMPGGETAEAKAAQSTPAPAPEVKPEQPAPAPVRAPRPAPAPAVEDDFIMVDTLSDGVDVNSELSKLDGLLDKVTASSRPAPAPTTMRATNLQFGKEETRKMSDNTNTISQAIEQRTVAEETSVITASTILSGDIQTAGSFDIQGTINGNVSCYGKLVVTGTINGNSSASEFFADVANIEGEVVSSGTVKVGAGSVIIGNITASSAVIAGAVKGDIDVQGPVVVDTSAVIMGNIKSRSVQINNGAVIEGFCSQCYADVDVQSIFNKN